MHEESHANAGDDRDLAALLAAAGARVRPASGAMAEAKAAVEAEWRATVAARRRRQRTTAWAAAAGVAVAAVALWVARPWMQPGHEVAAEFVRVVGDVQQDVGDGRWTSVTATDPLASGARLRTGSEGRAALRLVDGVELRLDSRSLVIFEGPGRARLAQGAVYVDSGAPTVTVSPEFTLETPAGRVRHLGTQYEARLVNHAVRVAIREGRVEVGGHSGTVQGTAGEQLVLEAGRVTRTPLAPTDAAWQWIATVTPPFSVEGRSVDDFLDWVARETGRTIAYATPETARRARGVVLRGTVEGLTPDEAVVAVLSTTSLQPRVESGRILVEATVP